MKSILLNLPKVSDQRGNLSFIESQFHVPFEVHRAYWIYDVPGGEMRGSHAFRKSEEFIVALSGSFDVVLHDGVEEQRIHLCRSYKGVYVPAGTWRCLENFSTNSLGLVLASTAYDEADYIWDFESFKRYAQALNGDIHTYQEGVDNIVANVENAAKPVENGAKVVDNCSKTQDNSSYAHQRVYKLEDVKLFTLPSFTELRRGCLTAVETGSTELPFDLKRVFYIYDIPSGTIRGAHAHYEAWQFIVAASSSFEVVLTDGEQQQSYRLDRPFKALLVPPGIWCHLHDFSSAAVALVLTSEHFDLKDYICDYDAYLRYRSALKKQ